MIHGSVRVQYSTFCSIDAPAGGNPRPPRVAKWSENENPLTIGPTSTKALTIVGWSNAKCSASIPPAEQPITVARSIFSDFMRAWRSSMWENGAVGAGDRPYPRRSQRTARAERPNSLNCSSHVSR